MEEDYAYKLVYRFIIIALALLSFVFFPKRSKVNKRKRVFCCLDCDTAYWVNSKPLHELSTRQKTGFLTILWNSCFYSFYHDEMFAPKCPKCKKQLEPNDTKLGSKVTNQPIDYPTNLDDSK